MKSIFTLLIAFITVSLSAQQDILEPVKWNSKAEKVSDTEYDIVLLGDY